jgi:hypothetical protein
MALANPSTLCEDQEKCEVVDKAGNSLRMISPQSFYIH